MPRRPRQPPRAPLLAAALIAACHFESAGLGDANGQVAGSAADTTSPGAQTGEDSTIGPSSGATSPADSDSSGGNGSGNSTSGAPPPPPPGCGNGVVDDGEQCDGGSDCTPACSFHVCGDGYIGAGEQCDEAAANGDDQGCTSACQNARCGDGLLGPGEACDDGNAVDTDACLAGCVLASCGDGFQQAGLETCDLGADNGAYGGACNLSCDGPGPSCGDGVWDPQHEACDGDGTPDGTDCKAGCKPVCAFAKYDCNGDPADGCQDLYIDKNNCGTCGKKCQNVCVLKICY